MNQKKTSLILLILIFAALGVTAQSNTLYYLNGAPQSYRLNPATQPQCRFFLGLPVLNSLYLETYNNSFGLTDMLWNDPETGQVLQPFSSDAALDDFLGRLTDENTLSMDIAVSPVSIGLGIKEMYFTFDMTMKMDLGIYYPSDFIPLFIPGIPDGSTFDFSSLGFHVTGYVEYALGVSRKFMGDMLQVGIRPKLITGIGTISSTDNNITLDASTDTYELNSQMELNICAPGFIFPLNEEGNFDLEQGVIFDSTLSSVADYRSLLMSNKGLGVDIGVHVKPIEGLTLSASLIDLGYIKWKEYVHTLTLEGSVEFNGIDVQTDSNTSDFSENLLDSIVNNFDFHTTSGEPFKSSLEPKLYIGGSYAVLPKLDVGLLSRFDFTKTGTKANLMIHANWHPSNAFNLTANYSPFGGRASTFGLGFATRGGPLSFYTVADYRAFRYNLYKYENIPVFIAPANRDRFNIQIGFNLVFGCNMRKRLMKDKPMYFSDEY